MKLSHTLILPGIFLILCIVLDLWGDTNTRSRLALLHSIKEDRTLRIDSYQHWTIDWARTPDGHYFSNKAPGPVFLALPFYWILDSAITWKASDRTSRDRMRAITAERQSQMLSVLLQALPFAFIFFWALRILKPLSFQALRFFGFAYFFGSTATLFMNTFFGHALAAVCATGLLLALLDKRVFVAGTLFGWGVLCDYGSALLLPGTLILLVRFCRDSRQNLTSTHRRLFLSKIPSFLLGGLVPGALWIFYHQLCFGGLFTLPNRYQNPDFVTERSSALWGIFQSYPKPTALFELLFGSIRGLLFTQPWILIVFFLVPWIVLSSKFDVQTRRVALFCGSGLFFLLAMNASFINWHAGGSPGPRYLSAIFPSFSLLATLLYHRVKPLRLALWVGLVVGLGFNSLVFASHRLQNPEDTAVWNFFFSEVFLSQARMPWARFGVFWGGLAIAWMAVKKLRLNAGQTSR